MSDTPETDEFFEEWTFTSGVLARSRLHAEKLERDRNEWRKCAERLAAIVAADETEFHLANDIDLALEEFNQLKNKYERLHV